MADAMYDGNGNPVFLSRKEANYLNSLGIVTGRNTSRGLVIWGSNTASFPGTSDVKDRFIPNRRQMDFIGNTVVTTFDEKIDKPGNRREIDAIINDINLWLADQQNSGYLLEYYVRFDHEENPDSEILNGHYKVHIGEGSPTPIESLEFVLEFTTGGFDSLAD
jgi:phage tail sheath protein FI